MKKGVVFTILTYFLFSVVLSLVFLTFSINKASNTEFGNRLAAFKTMYHGDRITSNLESVLNQEFSINSDNESIYVIFDTLLKSGMNPKDNLANYQDFLEIYNNKTPVKIKYDFSSIESDLNSNSFERIVQPFEMHTIFDYSTDTLTITNVQVLKSIGINLTTERDVVSTLWSTSSGDFDVYLITNGVLETRSISNSDDSRLTVKTETETIYIDFDFASNNNFIIDYANTSNMQLRATLEVSQLQESLLKTTSPYINIMNLSLGNYLLEKGLE